MAESVELELEEPLEMKPPKAQAPRPEAPVTKKAAPGFAERVIDNIKFQIGEVTLRLHTLGAFPCPLYFYRKLNEYFREAVAAAQSEAPRSGGAHPRH